MAEPLLSLEDMTVRFDTPEGQVNAIDGVSLAVARGECLGVVGESGSGKSQLFLAAVGLLAANGRAAGRAMFEGRDLLAASREELRRLRGARIAMIFQDPMTSLNPHLKVGLQLSEVLLLHKGLDESAARRASRDMLDRVRIPEAASRLDQYPHELSGGMRQRVMIAMALLCGPSLLIADEPTTALDVTVQAQILDLMAELVRETGSAMILITHDLGVVAGLADRVAVLYAGRIAESAPVGDIFGAPRHPYTDGLLRSMPRLDAVREVDLPSIPGQPPDLRLIDPGCPFRPRCARAEDVCGAARPPYAALAPDRFAACHRPLP